MELNNLRAFVSIAESGSVSLAAQQLYLTQPAVSKRLAALEDELQIKLFDRIGRKLSLTHAGTQMLTKAREILLQAQDMKHLASNLQSEVSGPLVLGTSHHIGLHRLPPILSDFRGQFPQVDLDIRFMDSEAACAAVEKGAMELAIVTLPPTSPATLISRQLWLDRLCFVAAQEHPLSKRTAVSLAELTRHPAVLPGPTTFTRGLLDRIIEENSLSLTLGMSTNYMETLKMLAEINLGWSLLPETMLEHSSLQRLNVDLEITRSLGLVTHAGRTLSNPAKALLSCLPE